MRWRTKRTFSSYFTFIYTVHRRIEGVYVENIVIEVYFDIYDSAARVI